MWFRLAQALGMSVAEAQEKINAREFAEWMAFDTLSPIGNERGDLQAASIATTIHNCFAGAYGGNSAELADYLLQFQPQEPVQQSQEALTAFFEKLAEKLPQQEGF